MVRSLALGLVMVSVAGCGGDAIEVGGTGNDGPRGKLPPSTGGPGATPLPTWPDPAACAATTGLELAGKWNAYFGRFQDAQADFQIDLRGVNDTGTPCGTLTWKPAAAPPVPATDPDTMYPPGVNAHPISGSIEFVEGFTYDIVSGRAQGAAVDVLIALTGPWRGWCALQTSTYLRDDTNLYECLPNWGGGMDAVGCFLTDPAGHQTYSVDCGKMGLCKNWRVCECNAVTCAATPARRWAFRLTLNGEEGTGNVFLAGWSSDFILRRAP